MVPASLQFWGEPDIIILFRGHQVLIIDTLKEMCVEMVMWLACLEVSTGIKAAS